MSQTCLPCQKAENNSTNGADDILFFRENMAWYFMWIADDSHENLNLIFRKKKKKKHYENTPIQIYRKFYLQKL